MYDGVNPANPDAAGSYEEHQSGHTSTTGQFKNFTPLKFNELNGLRGNNAFRANVSHGWNTTRSRFYVDADHNLIPVLGDNLPYYFAGDPIPTDQYDESGVTLGVHPIITRRTETLLDSKVVALQHYLFNDRLITTWGWREDEQELWDGDSLLPRQGPHNLLPDPRLVNPYDGSVSYGSGTPQTFGIVGYPLPWLGLFYNESENFVPLGRTYDIFGELFRLVRGDDGKVSAKRHVVSKSGNGHGLGFGDLNGDKKQDIVFQAGWYEQPAAGPFSGPWKYHHDFDLPHASCPVLILDLNKDGRNDIVWGDGHSYGLYWQEQLEPQSDGATTWRQHLIDKNFSQGHALAWNDVDNDGQPELITGKRYYGHSGRDAGAHDDITIQYYDWNQNTETWRKHLISTAPAGEGPGIGLQIRVHDLDGNGWKDIIVPGKSGTHIIWNDGM